MRAILVLIAAGAAAAKPPAVDDGVAAARSDLTCGSHTLAEGSYTISSPNHPSNYDNNYDCTYSLAASSGMGKFLVECPAFQLEASSNCVYDWLQVSSAKFCGTSGPSLTSVGTSLEVAFHSDYSVVGTGFQCTVTVSASGGQAQPLDCGAHTVTPGLYSITSPGFPSNYGNNLDCSYTITPGSGVNTMTLACCTFNIESHSSCSWDWLQVNGQKYCGSQGPALSETGEYNIDFHSDASVVKQGYYCEVRATS